MRTLVSKVLILQVCITVAASLIAVLFFDQRAVKSAAAAGIVAFIPALAYARVVARITLRVPPHAVLMMHAIAEALKLLLSLVLLALIFRFLHNELSMPYFIGAYVACLLSYGLALLFK